MVPSGLLLATLLIAQTQPSGAPADPTALQTAPLVSVQESLAEDAPEKLIAEAIEPTDHEALTGQPESLVSVLARMGNDRGRQLRAIVAYWQLVSAVADYHFRQHEVDYLRQLEGFEPSATADAAEDQTAGDPLRVAGADARRGQAQLDAIVAQHALAAWLGAPPTTPLPLPVDRPHVNAYRTYYQQLFPNGGSLTLRRIDATLPIRRQEIAVRARCVRRAEEALQFAETAYVSGRGARRQLLESLHRLSSEREMFVEAVRKYNIDIGEYAVTVARPGAAASNLVAMMLINPAMPPQASPTPGFNPSSSTPGMVPQPGTVFPGGFNQPATYNVPLVPARGRLPNGTPARFGEPTLAPPQAAAEVPQALENTTATDSSGDAQGWHSTGDDPSAGDSETEPGTIRIPDGASPIPTGEPADQDNPSAAGSTPSTDTQRVVYSPENSSAEPIIARTMALDTSRYRELARLSPKVRAQRLAEWIEEETPTISSESTPSAEDLRRVTLADCLDGNMTVRRSDAVAFYWHMWRAARGVAIRTWQVEQLEALTASAKPNHGSSDLAQRHLQTALESAEASRLGGIADLKRARLELVSRLANWPPNLLPAGATAPHAGGYNLKASTQSTGISNTREFHQLIDTIPRRHEIVVDCSTAVIDADAERTQALAANSTKRDVIVKLVEQQAAEELRFTEAVAAYNTEIARYVDLVVPATVPTDVFLKASVLR